MTVITMLVLRAGYWNGQYPRPGDTIEVSDEHVETLEIAGFAQRQNTGAGVTVTAPARRTKGSPHGRD